MDKPQEVFCINCRNCDSQKLCSKNPIVTKDFYETKMRLRPCVEKNSKNDCGEYEKLTRWDRVVRAFSSDTYYM